MNRYDIALDTNRTESSFRNGKVELWCDKRITVKPSVEHVCRPDIVGKEEMPDHLLQVFALVIEIKKILSCVLIVLLVEIFKFQ